MTARGAAWRLLLAGLLVGAGCTRGADETRVRADLQQRLDRDVKAGLFEVIGLRREGSSPLPAADSGAKRVLVYYNATLRLTNDYTFGAWDQLGPGTITYALGATEKGIFGVQPQNRAGDVVRAYGSAAYEESNDGWVPVSATVTRQAATPNIEGSEPPSRSKQLIDRLAAMVELPPPGVPPQQDEIIAEELARASENIERRVKRREHTFTLASGPEGGDYARFATALVDAVNEAAPGIRLRQRRSEGSVENAWLLARGEADYALVQGDVAAAALAGEGVFARGAALDRLRAVGGLFPEAIHVVVRADSPFHDIAQLRGRAFAIGAKSSGTRFDALAVLAAYDLTPADLHEAGDHAPADALARLRQRQVDAVFLTGAAPIRLLQEATAATALRLLPIAGKAVERIVQQRPGLTPLTLPPNTYPGQRLPVATLASAALLLTTADAPEGEVGRVADFVFTRMPRHAGGRSDVVRVSAHNELRGVTIPLHPGAAQRTR